MDKTEEKRHNELDDLKVARSNTLLKAKYKTSLFEKKLIALAISKVRLDVNGNLVSTLSAHEIRQYLNIKGGGIYDQLRRAARATLGHTVILEDAENKRFDMFNVVTRCKYENGVFETSFNTTMKEHLVGLTQKYTTHRVSTLCNFHSNYSMRLYEILSTHAWVLQHKKEFTISYALGEIRAELGTFDSSSKEVMNAVKKGIDWNVIAEEIAPDRMFESWRNFRQRVLEPAQEEINNSELSEFHVEFKPIAQGRANKTVGIKFFITSNIAFKYKGRKINGTTKEKSNISEEEFDDIDIRAASEVKEMLGEYVSNHEALSLLREAKGDVSLVEKAFQYAKQKKELDNMVGFMIMAIRKKWSMENDKPYIQGKSLEDTQTIVEIVEEQKEYSADINKKVEAVLNGDLEIEDLDPSEVAMILKAIQIKNRGNKLSISP